MTNGHGQNGSNSSGGIMAAIQFYGREIKKPRLQPGFSAAPHSSAALTIVTAHYKKGVPFIWEEKRTQHDYTLNEQAVFNQRMCTFLLLHLEPC